MRKKKLFLSFLSATLLLLSCGSCIAQAHTRPVSLAKARRVIEASYSFTEPSMTACRIEKEWTDCEVSVVLETEQGVATTSCTPEPCSIRRVPEGEAVGAITHVTETALDRVYVRQHRLILVEVG